MCTGQVLIFIVVRSQMVQTWDDTLSAGYSEGGALISSSGMGVGERGHEEMYVAGAFSRCSLTFRGIVILL